MSKKKRKCPGPDAESPCGGSSLIEKDRAPTAQRCKKCSALRTNRKEAARRRELRRLAREGRALSATATLGIPPAGDPRRKCPGPDAEGPCGGSGLIEKDRAPTAQRCKKCSALRTNRKEAARRRELRRLAREEG